jgi:hypothetical protein
MTKSKTSCLAMGGPKLSRSDLYIVMAGLVPASAFASIMD